MAIFILVTALVSAGMPVSRQAGPAVAAGCTAPYLGRLIAVYHSCEECVQVGDNGISQSNWLDYSCRPANGLYYLRVTGAV